MSQKQREPETAQVGEINPQPTAPLPPTKNVAELLADLKAKEPLILAVLAERAEELELQRQSRLRSEAIKAQCEMSALERTQHLVEQLYGADGRRRFQVNIPKDSAQLTLSIPARNREEAITKYNTVCGIRSTNHDHVAQPVAA